MRRPGLVAFLWRWTTELAQQAAKAAEARAAQIVADGQVAAGRDAIAIAIAAHESEMERQTQDNHDAILNAPGAGVQLDPGLDAVTRLAVCLRASARVDAACVAMLHPRPD